MFDISEIHIIHLLLLILIHISAEIIKWGAFSELGEGVAKGPHFVVDVGQKFLNNQDIWTNSKKGIGIEKTRHSANINIFLGFFYYGLILGLKPESAVWSQEVGLTATYFGKTKFVGNGKFVCAPGLTATYFGKTKFVGKGKFVCAPECKDRSELQKVGVWLRQNHWNEKMMFYQSR